MTTLTGGRGATCFVPLIRDVGRVTNVPTSQCGGGRLYP